ncbi:ATP-grasp domain-containing protein, partial [Streptomyces durbertensis]
MASIDTEVPALLLRLDGNPFHHGTLGAVRTLGRAGVEVHVMLDEPAGPVLSSRHLHRAHRRPAGASADHTRLLGELRRTAALIGRRAVLVAMDDRGAIAVARLAGELADHYLLPSIPPGLPEQLTDKSELALLCARLNVPHPVTRLPGSATEAATALEELGGRAVAKWVRPWLLPPGSGLRGTSLVPDAATAARLFTAGTPAGSRLLLQQLLPAHGTDWFFHGCFDRHGRFLAGGTGVKTRSWPPRAGLTAVGRWVPNRELTALACRLAADLGYHGILDLDFRHVDGGYHLLDFNPRPGAQFRLFTDAAGTDVVRAHHLDLTGRPVPPGRARPGRLLVVENYAAVALLTPASGTRPAPAGSRPTPSGGRPAIEAAWFAADDPMPFLAVLGTLARRLWH